MALHLIKLAVGVQSVNHLRELQNRRIKSNGQLHHITRFKPKRAEQILKGGSIYWVVRNFIRVRQPIVGFSTVNGETSSKPKCAVLLDPKLVLTVPVRRRPHQGWRYLESASIPPDLDSEDCTYSHLPLALVNDLRELGLV